MIIRRFHSCRIINNKIIEPLPKWWNSDTKLCNLVNYGLTKSQLLKNRKKLSMDYDYLKHSIEVLREAGIPITIDKVIDFKDIYSSYCLEYLEKKKVLPPGVTTRFLNLFEAFPFNENIKMPSYDGIAKVYRPILQYHRQDKKDDEIQIDWPNNVQEEQKRTLQTEQRRILRQYYAWRLSSDLYAIDIHMYNYSKITGLRCLASIRQTIDILSNELELDRPCILKNFFLLSITPSRLTDVINNVDKIGKIPLKSAVKISPKIIAKTSDKIKEIEDILKEYNIPDEGCKYRILILTFTPSTIRKRLQEIANGDLAPFLKHPRICNLIYYFNKASARMEQIKKSGFKFISLNILTGNEQCFQRFLVNGVDHSRHFSDVCNYLAGEFGVTKSDVTILLSLHPSHKSVTLNDVRDTLEYLFSENFSIDVLLESIHVVLYSKEKISKTLKYIADDVKLNDLGFKNGFVSEVSDKFPNTTKFRDKRLVLCIYFLEKPHHFTGEGTTRTNE